MSEFVLASPSEAPEEGADRDRFGREVLAAWPDARLVEPPDGSGMVASAWIRRGPDGWDDVVLDLHPDGLALSIDAREPDTVAAVAAWWRAAVPATVPELWLFDATGTGWSVLVPGSPASAVFPRK